MNNSYFKNKEVSFSDYRLKILRNNFPIKELKYDEIDRVEISRGFLLKNNLVVILCCFGLIYFGYSILKYGYVRISNESMVTHTWLMYFFNKGSIISVWGPLLIVIAGLSGIYASFIRTHIITIYAGNTVYRQRIREVSISNKVVELGQFLVKRGVLTINKCT